MKTVDEIATACVLEWFHRDDLLLEEAIKLAIEEATKQYRTAIIEWNNATNNKEEVHETEHCTLSYPCDGCKRLLDAEIALCDLALEGEKNVT